MISSSSFDYDAASNVTQDNNFNKYLYDGEGRICAVKSLLTTAATGYIYDANGIRVAKGSLTSFSCNLSTNGFEPTNDYILGRSGEQLTEMQMDSRAASWSIFAPPRTHLQRLEKLQFATKQFDYSEAWLMPNRQCVFPALPIWKRGIAYSQLSRWPRAGNRRACIRRERRYPGS